MSVDQELNWKLHTQHVCRKIMKSIGILIRICSLINTRCMIILYYSLIYPVICLGCKSYLIRIFLILKTFLGLMSFSDSLPSSAPPFRKCIILTVFDVNIDCICPFMFKYVLVTPVIPRTYNHFSSYSSDVGTSSTRRCRRFYLPFCRKMFLNIEDLTSGII